MLLVGHWPCDKNHGTDLDVSAYELLFHYLLISEHIQIQSNILEESNGGHGCTKFYALDPFQAL